MSLDRELAMSDLKIAGKVQAPIRGASRATGGECVSMVYTIPRRPVYSTGRISEGLRCLGEVSVSLEISPTWNFCPTMTTEEIATPAAARDGRMALSRLDEEEG